MTKAPQSSSRSQGHPPARDAELGRLADLLPASGRMWCRLVSQPRQTQAIKATLPKPWNRNFTIGVNLDLWQQLPQGQRDLLLLRTVCWGTDLAWLKPGGYQALLGVGLIGALVETARGDAAGIVVFSGLGIVATRQIWRSLHSTQTETAADEAALRVATRRGYTEAEAARHLIGAIKALPAIEGRVGTVNELLRCQTLKPTAQQSGGAV